MVPLVVLLLSSLMMMQRDLAFCFVVAMIILGNVQNCPPPPPLEWESIIISSSFWRSRIVVVLCRILCTIKVDIWSGLAGWLVVVVRRRTDGRARHDDRFLVQYISLNVRGSQQN